MESDHAPELTKQELDALEARLRESMKDLEDRIYSLEKAKRFSQGFFDVRVDI